MLKVFNLAFVVVWVSVGALGGYMGTTVYQELNHQKTLVRLGCGGYDHKTGAFREEASPMLTIDNNLLPLPPVAKSNRTNRKGTKS